MSNEQAREEIAKACNHAVYPDGAGIGWDSLTDYERSIAYEDADQILSKLKELGSRECAYCHKKPNGAMLSAGYMLYHVDCIIKMLNELLDPDWEQGYGRDPEKVVGYCKINTETKELQEALEYMHEAYEVMVDYYEENLNQIDLGKLTVIDEEQFADIELRYAREHYIHFP